MADNLKFSYRLISKVSAFIFDLWKIQLPCINGRKQEQVLDQPCHSGNFRFNEAAWFFMSVVHPGEVSMTSVADSRTARGVFNSWDTAAIKIFLALHGFFSRLHCLPDDQTIQTGRR